MKKNTNEKSLVNINESSIFYRIKQFFKGVFNNKKILYNTIIEDTNNIISQDSNNKKSFIEEIKNIENEETKLMKLQNKYRSGEIREEDMTEEQICSLCNLYDIQIAKLKESNDFRKQKLLEYKKIQTKQ